MSGLEIFPHPTCEVKGSGDCEFLHHISHMASENWEVGLKREFPFLKVYPQERIFSKIEFTFHVCFTNHIWHLGIVICDSHFTFPTSQITLLTYKI